MGVQAALLRGKKISHRVLVGLYKGKMTPRRVRRICEIILKWMLQVTE
jgi:hypothetical protein